MRFMLPLLGFRLAAGDAGGDGVLDLFISAPFAADGNGELYQVPIPGW